MRFWIILIVLSIPALLAHIHLNNVNSFHAAMFLLVGLIGLIVSEKLVGHHREKSFDYLDRRENLLYRITRFQSRMVFAPIRFVCIVFVFIYISGGYFLILTRGF